MATVRPVARASRSITRRAIPAARQPAVRQPSPVGAAQAPAARAALRAALGPAGGVARWTRSWRVGALAATLLAGAALVPATGIPGGGGCSASLAAYRQAAAGQLSLSPYYEVGLGSAVYGPGPGIPVPWERVRDWAALHPATAITACQSSYGWMFAALDTVGGYAYVQLAPDGRLAKLYLSSQPIDWN